MMIVDRRVLMVEVKAASGHIPDDDQA